MLNKLFYLSLLLVLTACSNDAERVGKVSLGLLTTKDVKVLAFNDPKVPGVTCHISHVDADLSLADPSDMSIACRQTGPIASADLSDIDLSANGEVVFTESKSVFFKRLKIRRIYDADNQVLLYLSYSTKEINGSHKHSLSTVPLWQTGAWKAPAEG
ncbi:CreA family protein [Reinekea marinisedimentorum]|uniref:CreA protein n=1 Tax=Reinekea marinisedimentorum TaxID=230495 RepID=A0A4R3IAY0_9GAMM|nr:CreA family protein [Reinekea marinisedimentorum]TCS42401.1 CreA protein [Reinekea marinisedimentorum]